MSPFRRGTAVLSYIPIAALALSSRGAAGRHIDTASVFSLLGTTTHPTIAHPSFRRGGRRGSFAPGPSTCGRYEVAHTIFAFIGPSRYYLVSRPFVEVILWNGWADEPCVRNAGGCVAVKGYPKNFCESPLSYRGILPRKLR